MSETDLKWHKVLELIAEHLDNIEAKHLNEVCEKCTIEFVRARTMLQDALVILHGVKDAPTR